MKKALNGNNAYMTITNAKMPQKTDSYTPISHISVIDKIRQEIGLAGFEIDNESFKSSNNGDIATGSFLINYKEDPDIQLAANFQNSYNKMYAFKFILGSMVLVCSNGLMINNGKFGTYKRVHKGDADILAEHKISDYIKNADMFWDKTIKHKELLKHYTLTRSEEHDILGELFLRQSLLTSPQMNIIKSEMTKPSFNYGVDYDSAWSLYNHITYALKESHPSSWIDDHIKVHDLFMLVTNIEDNYEDDVIMEGNIEKQYTIFHQIRSVIDEVNTIKQESSNNFML